MKPNPPTLVSELTDEIVWNLITTLMGRHQESEDRALNESLLNSDQSAQAIASTYQHVQSSKTDELHELVTATWQVSFEAAKLGFQPFRLSDYLTTACLSAGRNLTDFVAPGAGLESLCNFARRLNIAVSRIKLAVRAEFIPTEPALGVALARSGGRRSEEPASVVPDDEIGFAAWLDEQERHYTKDHSQRLNAALTKL